MKWYSTTAKFLVRRCVTNENKAKLDAKLRNLRQALMATAEQAQIPCKKRLSCGSVHDKKYLKALFVEQATHPMRNAIRHCRAENQDVYLADLTQRAEMLLDLQEGRLLYKETMNVTSPKRRCARRNGNPRKRKVKNVEKEMAAGNSTTFELDCIGRTSIFTRLLSIEFVVRRLLPERSRYVKRSHLCRIQVRHFRSRQRNIV